jgi:Predicted transcriptional regulators
VIKIVMVPVAKLAPYAKNAKKHKDFDISAIADSIREFGFNDPVGIWSSKNIIVEGHGRVLAAQKLGIKEVPCIRLDFLTDEERRAYGLAHNKTAELSEWDDERLNMEMSELDYDFSMFGFGAEQTENADRFTSAEFDLASFGDEEFDYECQNCGFKFNA